MGFSRLSNRTAVFPNWPRSATHPFRGRVADHPGAATGSSGGRLAPAPAQQSGSVRSGIHAAIIAPLAHAANPGAANDRHAPVQARERGMRRRCRMPNNRPDYREKFTCGKASGNHAGKTALSHCSKTMISCKLCDKLSALAVFGHASCVSRNSFRRMNVLTGRCLIYR